MRLALTALPGTFALQILHYFPHLLIPEIGPDGQRRLKVGSVLIVGTIVDGPAVQFAGR
jgi:hypothetical protein